MLVSGISSKAQTTIPRAVRAALGLRDGDRIAYEIDGDRVILTRANAVDDPFATSPSGARTQTPKPMPSFERGTIVRVPFPYTDRNTRQRRPR